MNVIDMKTNHAICLYPVSKEVIMEVRMQDSKLNPSNRSGKIFILYIHFVIFHI